MNHEAIHAVGFALAAIVRLAVALSVGQLMQCSVPSIMNSKLGHFGRTLSSFAGSLSDAFMHQKYNNSLSKSAECGSKSQENGRSPLRSNQN